MSQPPEPYHPFQPGDRVIGTVYRIRGDRILLRLPGGAHGIIRQREMSWEEEAPDPEALVKVDSAVEAVVVDVDLETRSVELSLRFAQRDPWKDIEERYGKGTVVGGTVLGVREFGAFVEIEPGVAGLIPVGEIRQGRLAGASEALWVEDHVLATVMEIDPKRRQLTLSIRAYLESLAQKEAPKVEEKRTKNGRLTLADLIGEATLRSLRQHVGELPEDAAWPKPGRLSTILVADDNEEFNKALTELLQGVGYKVGQASTFEEALERVEEQPYDLAILDLSLKPNDPLNLAKRITGLHPRLPILLLSGFEVEEETQAEARHAGFLLEEKPIGPRALAKILRRLEAGSPLVSQTAMPVIPASPEADRGEAELSGSSSSSEVERLLGELLSDSGASGAVLFEKDENNPGQVLWHHPQKIRIEDSRDVRSTLLYSPVGEVLRGRPSVSISDASQTQTRVTYLFRAVAFRSCFGTRIEIDSRSEPYALFLFSDQPNTFPKAKRTALEPKLRELGTHLFRRHTYDRFLELQDDLLQSRLRAGALHDLRNTMDTLGFKLARLSSLVQRQETKDRDRESLRSLALEIQASVNQMVRTADLFKELGRSEKLEPVDVNELMHRVVERQKALASHMGVVLSFDPDHKIPETRMNRTQLHQVVDNLVLNALQWSVGRLRKHVQVTTHFEERKPEPAIRIRIADTGPGIHHRLQEKKIFDLGYSTRADGSGLGLFVARQLLDTLGGKVSVENSVMEVGSTFRVDLPVRKRKPVPPSEEKS